MNRYETIQEIRNKNPYVGTIGDEYYDTVYYPEVGASEGDIYVETEFGDRLDALAYQFYGDTTLYWIIAIRNPNKVNFGSIYLSPGSQIAIPQDISTIVDEYRGLNEL
jgi:phage tail protein X